MNLFYYKLRSCELSKFEFYFSGKRESILFHIRIGEGPYSQSGRLASQEALWGIFCQPREKQKVLYPVSAFDFCIGVLLVKQKGHTGENVILL